MRKVLIAIVLVLALVVGGAACGGGEEDAAGPAGDDTEQTTSTGDATTDAEPQETTQATEPQEITDVQIGVAPYLDNQTAALSKELGFDQEMGMNFEIRSLASNDEILRAVRTGDLDVGVGTIATLAPLIKQAPELRNWVYKDQFSGFIVVGRKGEAPVYDELIDQGVDPEEARRQVIESWRGKTFNLVAINFAPLVYGALESVGMSRDDVEIVDFASDPKAAQAFRRGNGDFYMGGLPQEVDLLLNYPDEFVGVAGNEVLGPGGLWYDTWTSTDEWLAENQDLADRFLAVSLRTMRYIDEVPEASIPILTRLVNGAAAGNLDEETVSLMANEFTDFLTLEELQERALNPDSEAYWRVQADFIVDQNEENLPENYNVEDWEVSEAVFESFLERRSDLVEWINSPLPFEG